MSGFIEITDKNNNKHLINTNLIEEVVRHGDGSCTIYLAYNTPYANDQDYFYPIETYDQIKDMILNSNIAFCNCSVRGDI